MNLAENAPEEMVGPLRPRGNIEPFMRTSIRPYWAPGALASIGKIIAEVEALSHMRRSKDKIGISMFSVYCIFIMLA